MWGWLPALVSCAATLPNALTSSDVSGFWLPAVASCIVAKAPVRGDPAIGRKIFESQCALCHGLDGSGGRGPGLNRPRLFHAPDDNALRQVISDGIPPEMPPAWQMTEHERASLTAYVRSLGSLAPEKPRGDPARGAAVYQSKGCVACHIVSGRGEALGPELTNIGAMRNGTYLRRALLRPSESLPEGFLFIAAVTPEGLEIRGVCVNEDAFSIQIKEAGGRFHSFRKSQLKQLHRLTKQTPMPSYASLAVSDLDDLVAYLAGLRGER